MCIECGRKACTFHKVAHEFDLFLAAVAICPLFFNVEVCAVGSATRILHLAGLLWSHKLWSATALASRHTAHEWCLVSLSWGALCWSRMWVFGFPWPKSDQLKAKLPHGTHKKLTSRAFRHSFLPTHPVWAVRFHVPDNNINKQHFLESFGIIESCWTFHFGAAAHAAVLKLEGHVHKHFRGHQAAELDVWGYHPLRLCAATAYERWLGEFKIIDHVLHYRSKRILKQRMFAP